MEAEVTEIAATNSWAMVYEVSFALLIITRKFCECQTCLFSAFLIHFLWMTCGQINSIQYKMRRKFRLKNLNFELQQIRHLSLNHDLTTLEANRPINRVLNRYRDVLPYDHSRVVLWDYEATDYINASLVEVSHLQDDQLPVCYTIALLMFTNLSRLQIFIQVDEWFIFVPGVWTSFGHYFSKKYLNSKK